MQYWNTGRLGYWETGVLEYGNTGVLEYWNTGVLEYWSIIVLEYCSTGGVHEIQETCHVCFRFRSIHCINILQGNALNRGVIFSYQVNSCMSPMSAILEATPPDQTSYRK